LAGGLRRRRRAHARRIRFENRAALVGAEIARIEGRALDAMDLYERAIRSARVNGFIHNEAIAYELAARFRTAARRIGGSGSAPTAEKMALPVAGVTT